MEPRWNLCDASGTDGGKVNSLGAFLESDDKVLVCTHATFRFAVDKFGVEAFDNCLIAVDEFHHVSANPDNKLGLHLPGTPTIPKWRRWSARPSPNSRGICFPAFVQTAEFLGRRLEIPPNFCKAGRRIAAAGAVVLQRRLTRDKRL